jgi:hypothetical protein
MTGLNELIVQEASLLEKLNEFNKYYSCYIRQTYNSKNSTHLPASSHQLCDSSITYEGNTLQTMAESLDASFVSFLEIIDDYNVDPSGQSIQQLITSHKKIQKKRNELDVKIKELNASQGSHSMISKMSLDSTVYASLLWTTIATALIYFTVTS